MISKEQLEQYRAQTFHSAPGLRLTSADQAVDYINERGIVLFWPNKETVFPSLWAAAAGDRPVADEHDDPGHVTWGWKDSLLGQRRVFYARVLKRRNTFISLSLLPSFYALSPNFGAPEEDYLIDYEAGQLTAEAKALYEALLQNGPLDTIALRKTARLTSKSSNGLFSKALDHLQSTFRVLPMGVSQAGAWKYSFVYDIVARHFPTLIEQAHPIGEWDARRNLILSLLESVGAATPAETARLFGWPAAHVDRATKKLIEQGILRADTAVEGQSAPCLALACLEA